MNEITRKILTQRIERVQMSLLGARENLAREEEIVDHRRASIANMEAEVDAMVESLGLAVKV